MKLSISFGICQICGKIAVLDSKKIQVAKGAYRKYKTYKVCSDCKKELK